jgi:hypothetical protein
MNELSLQLNLFEQTTKSIEVTEIDGMETGGLLQYFDVKDRSNKVIQTCAGDIAVIINALEDYARLLDKVIEEWQLEGYHGAIYELHAARCRKISAKYQKASGYNYETALAKCRKRKEKADDVGEESLTLMAKYGKRDSKNEGNITDGTDDLAAKANSVTQIALFK